MTNTRIDSSTNSRVRPTRRSIRRISKDKPKRPLSAYNYFFKNERIKIIKAVNCHDKEEQKKIDPELNEELIGKLLDSRGRVSFEEIGKLIGSRWKKIGDELMTHYSFLAEEDKKRYAFQLEAYKQLKKRMHRTNDTPCFIENNHTYPHGQHRPPICTQGANYAGRNGPSYVYGYEHRSIVDPTHCQLHAAQFNGRYVDYNYPSQHNFGVPVTNNGARFYPGNQHFSSRYVMIKINFREKPHIL